MYMDTESMTAMAENDVYLVLTMSVMQTLIASDAVPDFYRTNTEEAVEYRRSRMAEARDLGVKFAMGTDAGAPTLPHGENALELECMVDAGLDPLDAIEISTAGTAELLELDDRVGTLREGFEADLLAVAGDPTEDVTVLRDASNVELVLVGGRVVKEALS
jgi:imidazolonepropionase-like amidohydrolase